MDFSLSEEQARLAESIGRFIDNDYEVYEGSLDGMYDHDPVYCTTGGQTTSVLEPDPEHDTYYLVVPTNASQEGSYGRDSAGALRPASGTPCRPRPIFPTRRGSMFREG